ncbi:hypothetical protein DFS34DRAFT_594881 [Phlyctochytrium arcticum]|nr:hypothetical protein DFS34DRAFT_594881 [Phlyctochytrium arcticum]
MVGDLATPRADDEEATPDIIRREEIQSQSSSDSTSKTDQIRQYFDGLARTSLQVLKRIWVESAPEWGAINQANFERPNNLADTLPEAFRDCNNEARLCQEHYFDGDPLISSRKEIEFLRNSLKTQQSEYVNHMQQMQQDFDKFSEEEHVRCQDFFDEQMQKQREEIQKECQEWLDEQMQKQREELLQERQEWHDKQMQKQREELLQERNDTIQEVSSLLKEKHQHELNIVRAENEQIRKARLYQLQRSQGRGSQEMPGRLREAHHQKMRQKRAEAKLAIAKGVQCSAMSS